MRSSWLHHLLALAWALACAGALLTPSSRIPGGGLESGWVEVVELAVHLTLAAILAILTRNSLVRLAPTAGRRWTAPLLAFAYLILLEAVQELVPGRGWGWDDVAVTALGVLAGALPARRGAPSGGA